MAVVIVSSGAALNAALASAQAGDTIKLAQGTYSAISARNLQFAQAVTITSQDGLAPAVVTDINITSVSGLRFTNLEFQASAAGGDNAFKVTSSQDIHFDHLNVHGSLDGNPQNDVIGFLIRTSDNVSVTDSEFQQLSSAVGHLDDTNLVVSGNHFHDLRTDAIRGGGSSHVTVSGNTFTDFYPVAGDHGDAIQFWTTNTSVSAHDITVTDNLFLRGAGSVAQGVFLRDEVGGLPYQRVTITGNFMIGTMYNGIAIDGGREVTIDHNTVVGFTDMKSWIRLDSVTGGAVTNNSANVFLAAATNSSLAMSANTVVPLAADAGAAALQQWSAQHPGAGQLLGDAADNILNGGFGISVLRGGDGADRITGSGAAEDINGNQGADTIHGGAGEDWVVGGKDNDLLFGDAGNDIVLGNLGDDTLDGGDGADQVRGGQGDDLLNGGPGDDWLSGDRGADTITGGAGADTFHSFSGAGLDRVVDFSFSAGDRVLLDAGTTYVLRASGLDTIVDMGNGDQLVLVGVPLASLPDGWILPG